ncbi:stage II sporulation protein P [Halobacillus massiliensis]|uniref:stage II sporulation protein P n=1 Tax=Halobacillus massiliensis TaxID=1926286 RepID=UPI0009E3C735|nr:stage II sporulation protein P [Halobacillus massiliensis]
MIREKNYLILAVKASFLCVFVSYFLVSVITNHYIKEYMESSIVESLSKIFPEDLYLFLMGQELTLLRMYSFEEDKETINWLELATNVEIGDFRSLLGREIPGLERYQTEIIIAGEGTNIGNLPRESPPPTGQELENQKVNQKELDKAHEKDPPKESEEVSEKNVYIYHSHSWEAFKPLIKNGEGSLQASSTNEEANVVAVGERLRNELERRGIGVIHNKDDVDKELKERNWNYNNSYELSREKVTEALAQNEEISYLIDIHRDSQSKDITTKIINDVEYARLFFVVGKENKNYEKNLMIAKELNYALEKNYPGISRGVFVKTKLEGNGVYNQDLTERSLLVEFGGVDNNLTELYNSIEAFAETFGNYYEEDVTKVMGTPEVDK